MGYSRRMIVDAPLSAVWIAWASAETARKWLAPGANIVFKVGGAYEFFWDQDPALDSTLGCKLLQVDPEQSLVFEWQGKTEFLPMFQAPVGGPTIVGATFRQTEGGVEVTVAQAETRDLPDWSAYDEWMATAWEKALRSLKAFCEGSLEGPYWEQ